jgi:diketogulonate reductase-like aldo/keto reductase
MLQRRRLGRTGMQVSVVGFGTAQFRLVPEQRAIDALKHGFSLGVNLVRTAPDYEGADDLAAQAGAENFPHILENKPAANAARECNPLALMKKPLMRNQRWESFLRQHLKMFRDGRSR